MAQNKLFTCFAQNTRLHAVGSFEAGNFDKNDLAKLIQSLNVDAVILTYFEAVTWFTKDVNMFVYGLDNGQAVTLWRGFRKGDFELENTQLYASLSAPEQVNASSDVLTAQFKSVFYKMYEEMKK